MLTLRRVEWPTVWLAAACTLAWLAVTYAVGVGGAWWLWPVVIGLCVLHSSLQHEALHGHPTSHRLINEALVFLPVGLVYPYRRFKSLHLQHHHDENLTDPFEDPETWYLAPEDWAKAGPILRRLKVINNAQAGRLVFGPALSIIGLAKSDLALMRAGDRAVRLAWLLHAAGLFPVMAWVWGVCGINPLLYFIGVAYPALSILGIRTFIEHQATEAIGNRSVINEDRGLLAFLFLNNSLHYVHHSHPTVAWYRLPQLYRENRERFLSANGGYRMASYGEVFRRFGFKAKESVEHPLMAKGRWKTPRPHA